MAARVDLLFKMNFYYRFFLEKSGGKKSRRGKNFPEFIARPPCHVAKKS